MNWQIAAVLGMLTVAVALFVSERLRVDVVALLLMASLALSGLVEPLEAIAGFSNPAVVTIWSIFILSGGLARTGVAKLLGHRLLRLAGHSEVRLLLLIMTASAALSAFMSNVGVTALLLPVVMDLARKTGTPPSRLLMPLAYSSLLGGLLTLIGTPPNILVSGALQDRGYPAFELFDFTILGGAVTIAGILYMVLVGRRFLPRSTTDADGTEPSHGLGEGEELPGVYDLDEQLFTLRLPAGSQLADRTLGESRLGSALRLNVLAILRGEKTHLAPQPEVRLEPGDRLLVAGSPRQTADLLGSQQLVAEPSENLDTTLLLSRRVQLAHVKLLDGASLLGRSPRELQLRQRGINLLALQRPHVITRRQIPRTQLSGGDTLLVQATAEALDELRADPACRVEPATHHDVAVLEGRLLALRLPVGSRLARGTLAQSRLGDALGFNVLGVVRTTDTVLMPEPDFHLREDDLLLVEGDREAVAVLRGLQGLQVEEDVPQLLDELESEQIALAEVILSPHTQVVGKTLQDLNFREKFGLQVVAVRRGGKNLRSNLRRLRLQLGDALLVYGLREKVRLLAREQDFLVLTEEAQEVLRTERAPVALAILAGVIATVLLGWLPIYIASVAGATAMVLSGCLSMEEAYRDIDWRAVFLIAGMLPLGQAMQNSGAAIFLAGTAVGTVGELGPMVVLASVFLLTVVCAQIMPTAAAAVLLAPIAFDTATHLGLSPQALLMAVAMGASASFMTPVGHPSNILVMGPGGYRFRDYFRIGLPLTLVVMMVVLIVLPILWPLRIEEPVPAPEALETEALETETSTATSPLSEASEEGGFTDSEEPVSSGDGQEINPPVASPSSPPDATPPDATDSLRQGSAACGSEPGISRY